MSAPSFSLEPSHARAEFKPLQLQDVQGLMTVLAVGTTALALCSLVSEIVVLWAQSRAMSYYPRLVNINQNRRKHGIVNKKIAWSE